MSDENCACAECAKLDAVIEKLTADKARLLAEQEWLKREIERADWEEQESPLAAAKRRTRSGGQ